MTTTPPTDLAALAKRLEDAARVLQGPVTPMPHGGARITIHPTRAAQLAEAIGTLLTAIEQGQGRVEAGAIKHAISFMRHDGLCAYIGGYGYCNCGRDEAVAALHEGRNA